MNAPAEKTVSVKVTVEVSWDRIADLLVCAYEGGSHYWARQDDGKPSPYKIDGDGLRDDFDFVTIDEHDDFSVKHHRLTRGSLVRGLQLMAKKYPQHFANAVSESNFDAETGDVYLQLCVLGELVYG